MDRTNHVRGVTVGVHVGDSIGGPFEKTYSAKRINQHIYEYGLGMFDYKNPWVYEDNNGALLPAGRPTDDSDQTADLAHSLITCKGLDVTHLRESLHNSVVLGVSRLWNGQATGAGGTTKKALSDDPARVTAAMQNPVATNGSLMRCSPMAIWMHELLMQVDLKNKADHVASCRELVRQMSAVTHAHPHAVSTCWIYTLVLSSLLAGNDPRTALEDTVWIDPHIESDPVFVRLVSSLNDPHLLPVDPGDWPARGYAEFSLYVALYSLLNTSSFAEGIEMAVRVAGDTDTYAAIAGGLLGGFYGYDAIPKEWRETILGHDQMVSYADELFAMRMTP